MEDRPIEAVASTRYCLCTICDFAGAEPIPEKRGIDFESFCAIADQDHEGHFRSALVPPKFVRLGEGQKPDLMQCRYYRAFMEAKNIAA
jgi:hypothetical protein